MPSLFSGINLALRALLSHQQAIEVIEHNVANAGTPGYHRQEAMLATGPPDSLPGLLRSTTPGQMGSGVLVERVRRFNLEFFDGRYRKEAARAKRWELERDVLQQVEATLGETTSDGLAPRLDDFWTGWQALSTDPTSTALRLDMRQRASALASALSRRSSDLRALRSDQDLSVIQRVGEVNAVASQVARLNVEITHVLAANDQPNDLLDERDRLLDRLAELAGATSSTQSNGEVLVSISGHALVVGNTAFNLTTSTDAANSNLVKITWADGRDFAASRGELAGMLDARDRVIPAQLTGLDDLAAALISRVNALHQSGYGLNNATGLDFFTGTDALSIRVSDDITDPVDGLANIAAAAAPNSPGDGSVAGQIADVQRENLMNGGTATLNQFYTGQVAELGLEVQGASTNADDRGLVANSLDMQRESVSGVSLDEEAANLVKSQRAFEAAARLMTAVDEMIDRVINGMGRVGL